VADRCFGSLRKAHTAYYGTGAGWQTGRSHTLWFASPVCSYALGSSLADRKGKHCHHAPSRANVFVNVSVGFVRNCTIYRSSELVKCVCYRRPRKLKMVPNALRCVSVCAKTLFVCVGLVGRNDSEPDCFSNLYKL
jgi:hypothetical protein